MTLRRGRLPLITSLVLLATACGGRVDAPSIGDAALGDGTGSAEAAAVLPVDDGTVWLGMAGPGCSGAIAHADACRTRADWWAQAAKACAASGVTVLYFEIGELCSGGAHQVKYTCCPSDVLHEKTTPSNDTCPPTGESWASESPCTEPLWCNYPDACGDLNVWHCKMGRWEQNTWVYCGR